ncbi:hypothetical protein [Methanobrevibacter sp.]|uniref:hypothetical protein n=1 Tax=Methanobrevibacter sp. TaxID=66852 RepID=UPI003863FD9A
MNLRNRDERLAHLKEAIICITSGTLAGLAVYQFFLYFNIAIFGWNLGLIFAPLIAGYVETIIANRILGEDIGAISAFILFAYTTYYSFILKNPTLGMNFITVGSIVVILQAAFPTLINYILIVVGVGVISYIFGFFKRITTYIYHKIKNFNYTYILKKPYEVEEHTVEEFDEEKSNKKINSLDFIFMTSTDVPDKQIVNLGQFYSTVILEKDKHLVHADPEQAEMNTLNTLKSGKDECLIGLTNKIKAAGGNGVLDLDIQYCLIGLGGDSYQVSAIGMGVYLK